MRRIVLAFMSTVAVVVMLFGYRTSTSNPPSAATTSVAAGTGNSTGGTTSTSPSAPGSSNTGSAKTVTGQTVQTRWGPVQVQITVSGSKITAADAVQVPSGNQRDVEINNQAVPVLAQETLQTQSANIDAVSGATITSDGYIQSLQSAIDQAGL